MTDLDPSARVVVGVWPAVWRRVRSDPILLGCVIILGVIFIAAALSSWVAPYPYTEQSLDNSFASPLSPGHILGTDHLGRDTLSRVLVGVRVSLMVSTVITAISLVVGLGVGVVAGYSPGRVDRGLSTLMDFAWSFPGTVVAIIIVSLFGPGISSIVLGLSLVVWAGLARLVRAEVLGLRETGYIEAAKAAGARPLQVVSYHLIPNLVPLLVVMASFYMSILIVAEAGLGFIGLGAQPPLPSLGQMLAEARNYLFNSAWMTIIPAVFLIVITLSFNLVGDRIRDLGDPTLS